MALHDRYSEQGLTILGIATAFEDFAINNTENLIRLAEQGEVTGETLRVLSQQGKLNANRLPYRIPFPLAMDRLTLRQEVTDKLISDFIHEHIPDFDRQTPTNQYYIQQQAQNYLMSLNCYAETFGCFELKGTPSQILVDKKGVLRDCVLGVFNNLEGRVLELLGE